MPIIVNPYQGQDPIAQAIANVGNAVFGNTGAGELRKQQILNLQRQNAETVNLGDRIKALGGAQNAAADPTVQAETIESGYSPGDLGKLGLLGSAIANGAAAPQTQNFQVGTGESYDNTAAATNAKLAEQAREFNQTPVDAVSTAGQPTFSTRAAVVAPGSTLQPLVPEDTEKGILLARNWNNLPTLDANQQAVLGAARAPGAQQTPRNYVDPQGATHITYDGIHDASTGQPLPTGGFIANAQGSAKDVGLTNSVKGNIQGSQIAQNDFGALADSMINLTNTHPEAFGAYGKVAGGVQGIAQSAQVLVDQMGGGDAFRNMLAGAQSTLAASGASPDIVAKFNTAIPTVDTLGPVLAFQAAQAVAQQSGRSVSDKDFQLFNKLIGDPQGWLSSAAETRARLQVLKAAVAYSGQMAQQYINSGKVVPDGLASAALAKAVAGVADGNQALVGAPAGPTTAAPAQPAAPSGAPVQIHSAADYAALPKGTAYVDPNGVQRVKQ